MLLGSGVGSTGHIVDCSGAGSAAAVEDGPNGVREQKREQQICSGETKADPIHLRPASRRS